MIFKLRDLNIELWRRLVQLYKGDPLNHVYIFYDIIYEPDITEVYIDYEDGEIKGYILIYYGFKIPAAHAYGRITGLLNEIPLKTLRFHVREGHLKTVISFLKNRGEIEEAGHFLDMAVNKEDFKPYFSEKAVPLTKKNLRDYYEIKRQRSSELTLESAKHLLSKRLYYGLYHNKKLVSIACAYLRLPEVWVIGDVYTDPAYRGRGYAKTVTSAITERALKCGARALLHVKEENTPAVRVYKRLGYKTIGIKYWFRFTPKEA